MIRRKIQCLKCNREISLSNFDKHTNSCSGPKIKKIRGVDFDPNHGYKDGTRKGWNKGLTKETSESVRKYSEKLKTILPKPKTDSGRKKLSVLAKERGLGGYRPHPNKGAIYNGVWFDSSWEILVAKSLDEHGVQWERPKTGYVWNNNNNKYYPDFFLPDFNVFLDPKNDYLRKKDQFKIESASNLNQIRILVLNETQLNWPSILHLITDNKDNLNN